MGELIKIGHICAPGSEFPMDFSQTKDAESMDNPFLSFYERAEALGARVGRWCTEMYSPPGVRIIKDRTYLRTTEPIPHGFG